MEPKVPNSNFEPAIYHDLFSPTATPFPPLQQVSGPCSPSLNLSQSLVWSLWFQEAWLYRSPESVSGCSFSPSSALISPQPLHHLKYSRCHGSGLGGTTPAFWFQVCYWSVLANLYGKYVTLGPLLHLSTWNCVTLLPPLTPAWYLSLVLSPSQEEYGAKFYRLFIVRPLLAWTTMKPLVGLLFLECSLT